MTEKQTEKQTDEAEAEPEPEVLHASCKLTWTFPSSSCASVSSGLAQAINSMTGFSNCVGEKCGYTLESANATGVRPT